MSDFSLFKGIAPTSFKYKAKSLLSKSSSLAKKVILYGQETAKRGGSKLLEWLAAKIKGALAGKAPLPSTSKLKNNLKIQYTIEVDTL